MDAEEETVFISDFCLRNVSFFVEENVKVTLKFHPTERKIEAIQPFDLIFDEESVSYPRETRICSSQFPPPALIIT